MTPQTPLIPLVPPSFAMTKGAANRLETQEALAITAVLNGDLSEMNLLGVRLAAKDALRTAQRAKKAPHTRGVLEEGTLREAEQVCQATLKTVHLIEANGLTENNKAVLKVFREWLAVMNREIPRAVWMAATKPPELSRPKKTRKRK